MLEKQKCRARCADRCERNTLYALFNLCRRFGCRARQWWRRHPGPVAAPSTIRNYLRALRRKPNRMRPIAPDGKAINQNTLAATLPDGLGRDNHGNRTALRHDIAAADEMGARTRFKPAPIRSAA
jgi:hypothetical protein